MAVEIKSQVSGTVLKVEVAVGASVSAGDTLLLLESMKMEIPVDAPSAGRVMKLLVAETDVIREGQLLVILAG